MVSDKWVIKLDVADDLIVEHPEMVSSIRLKNRHVVTSRAGRHIRQHFMKIKYPKKV